MKRHAPVLIFAFLALALIGLALAPISVGCASVAKDVTDAAKTYACISAEVDKGTPTFEKIAEACGVLVVQDVVDIVNSIIAAQTKQADGGLAAYEPTDFHRKLVAVHHK
jgi:hypothetical protein